MHIRNQTQLRENTPTKTLMKLRCDALDILAKGIMAIDPQRAVYRNFKLSNNCIYLDDAVLNLDKFSKIYVVGAGKASKAMAEAVESLLGDRISKGFVNVISGEENNHHLKHIELVGASHPIPDYKSVKGTSKILSLIEKAEERDLVIVLISGGGSALMTYPVEEVDLKDLQNLTEKLLRSGATINEINAVRKHLSAVKGGQLMAKAYPATVISLILSDVVGDPLSIIASGPTAPDNSTFKDAIEVLRKYDNWMLAPDSIRLRLKAGIRGEIEETPKPGDVVFKKAYNKIIGSNFTAAREAVERATSLGYNSILLSTRIEGEARHVGTVYAGIACEIAKSGHPIEKPAAIILGGETTVTVKGSGIGGRNQEMTLSSAIRIEGLNVVIASIATDGVDGISKAAGAMADGWTVRRARDMGLNIQQFLKDNDSHGFFSKLEDTILTGPTGTNVNDLSVILVV